MPDAVIFQKHECGVGMKSVLHPWQILLLILAGWINQHQQNALEYLIAANRILRENNIDGSLIFLISLCGYLSPAALAYEHRVQAEPSCERHSSFAEFYPDDWRDDSQFLKESPQRLSILPIRGLAFPLRFQYWIAS
jgi:hypothetical protein